MLLDLNFSNPESIEPQFFRAVLRDGVLEVPAANRQEVVR
jgi:CRISPR-associated protein Cas5d